MTDTEVRPDGVFDDIPEDVYHLDRGSLSVSAAKLLLPPSCPEKFKWAQDHPRKPKKVFDFGHVAHRLVLGKGAEIAVLDPAVHGLTKDKKVSAAPANTDMWKTAAADARRRGAVPIHIDEYRRAEVMAAKVLSDPDAGPLFVEGFAERSFYWTDPITGVQLRGRTDWMSIVDGRLWLVDVKTSTTARPDEFARKAYGLGYFMQFAWYVDLAIALGLHDSPVFVFVPVENDPPHVVTVVEYDAESYREGRRRNRQAIDLYARCRDRNEWPGYGPGIHSMSLPPWAFSQSEPTINDLLIAAELEGETE